MQEENSKKSLFNIALIVIGVLLGLFVLCVTAIIIAVIVFKPFDLGISDVASLIESDISESSYDHPLLTEDQEIMLESVGIDTATLPTELSQEQIDCGAAALGQERVNEIMSGAEPTFSDLLKARQCF